MADTCVAYLPGSPGICRNGFPQRPACHKHVRCFTCGATSPDLPTCLREDLGPPWLNDDGSPRLMGKVHG